MSHIEIRTGGFHNEKFSERYDNDIAYYIHKRSVIISQNGKMVNKDRNKLSEVRASYQSRPNLGTFHNAQEKILQTIIPSISSNKRNLLSKLLA